MDGHLRRSAPFGEVDRDDDGVAATFQETYDHFGNRNVEYLTYNGVQSQPTPYLKLTTGNNPAAVRLTTMRAICSPTERTITYTMRRTVFAR